MGNTIFSAAAIAMTLTLGAVTVPQVTDVDMRQNAMRKVVISYRIDAPAVVTLSVETNTLANGAGDWIDIGADNLTLLTGDVDPIVRTPGLKTIVWDAPKAWPDQVFKDNRVRAVVKAYSPDEPPDYLVVNLARPAEKRFFADAASIPDGVGHSRYKTDYLVLRKIPAANVAWRMGSPTPEANRDKYNEVPHRVTLTKDFYLGVYEVTQGQFFRVMGTRPAIYAQVPDADLHPIEGVAADVAAGAANNDMTLPDFVPPATSFTGKLRSLANDGIAYTLPSEAEWEFACRAGSGGVCYDDADLDAVAWHAGNWANDPVCASNQTHAVGQLRPNAFGLYDMLGNVREWVKDGMVQFTTEEQVDPCQGPVAASTRIMRGGGYLDAVPASGVEDVNWLRSAARAGGKWWSSSKSAAPDLTAAEFALRGFRIACPADFH